MIAADRGIVRAIFLLHRYLGIAVGGLMLVWCLSGMVMVYVPYPALPEAERLSALADLDLRDCRLFPGAGQLGDAAPIDAAALEMLAGRPVLDLRSAGVSRWFDLRTGQVLGIVDPGEAASAAELFRHARGIAEPAPPPARIVDDQWTVAGGFNADRPLYKFDFADPAGTEIYVSSRSGRIIQATDARQRFWNRLGAVPHWLYVTALRRNPALWTTVVVWTSLIGCFLTATGLYAGISQFRRRPAGRLSPYRGMLLLHHVPGLFFGVLTLSWVASGLISMNPWGFLGQDGSRAETALIEGAQPRWTDLRAALRAVVAAAPSGRWKSLSLAPLDGHIFLVAAGADGARIRFDAGGSAAPLSQAELGRIGAAVGADSSPILRREEDDFYYARGDAPAALPVYRVSEGGGTLLYLDPVSGAILRRIDPAARWYRWLHDGPHRLDFVAPLRRHPVRDLILPLLAGAGFVSGTGTWLALRRTWKLPGELRTAWRRARSAPRIR